MMGACARGAIDRKCMRSNGSWHAVGSPGVIAFIGFSAQTKLTRFESAGSSAHHTLPFSFNTSDATGTQWIGVGSAEVC